MATQQQWEKQKLSAFRLRGMGPKTRAKLAAVGVETALDLIAFLPRDYLDYSRIVPINDAPLDQPVHVRGVVIAKKVGRTFRRRFSVLEILVDDGCGALRIVWYNQPYLHDRLQKGQSLSLFGKIKREKLGRTMSSPRFQIAGDGEVEAAVTPVYREVGGIRSDQIRRWIALLLADMPDEEPLPPGISARYGFPRRRAAFQTLHAPGDPETAAAIMTRRSPAWRRLVFEEFRELQMRLRRMAASGQERGHPRIEVGAEWMPAFFASLPFEPTGDQRRVIETLIGELGRGRRLQALIQGDVGCGKTLVALAAAFLFQRAGFQAALMCPTVILARQHAEAARALLGPLGVRTALLTSRSDDAGGGELLRAVAAGEVDLAVGAHKLFQDDVRFHNLGLAMIDEQHRFGVDQRKALLRKSRSAAHYLAFTATPIPRSLALAVYGECQTLQIRQKPAGRGRVPTILKKAENRDEIIRFARSRIQRGESVFWVFPLIDEDRDQQEKSAVAMYETFKRRDFPPEWVGLAHGRMDRDALREEMAKFADGRRKILVATTVIEVGVDVPAASIMVIEGADRFGLSQLHQLRGRVGRGAGEAYCFLTLESGASPSAVQRVKTLASSDDGFYIAECDLKERGAGELLGKRQSGLDGFRFGDPWRDRELMEMARECALSEP